MKLRYHSLYLLKPALFSCCYVFVEVFQNMLILLHHDVPETGQVVFLMFPLKVHVEEVVTTGV